MQIAAIDNSTIAQFGTVQLSTVRVSDTLRDPVQASA